MSLIINGVTVVAPKSFKVTISDVDGETGRNAAGYMLRDRVAVKRKLECEWGLLSQADMSTLLQAVKSEFFTVQYPDPERGLTSGTFYVGDRSAPAYSWVNNLKPWSGLSMNFVER